MTQPHLHLLTILTQHRSTLPTEFLRDSLDVLNFIAIKDEDHATELKSLQDSLDREALSNKYLVEERDALRSEISVLDNIIKDYRDQENLELQNWVTGFLNDPEGPSSLLNLYTEWLRSRPNSKPLLDGTPTPAVNRITLIKWLREVHETTVGSRLSLLAAKRGVEEYLNTKDGKTFRDLLMLRDKLIGDPWAVKSD